MTVAAAVGLLMKQEPAQPVGFIFFYIFPVSLLFFLQWKLLEAPLGRRPNLFVLCLWSSLAPVM